VIGYGIGNEVGRTWDILEDTVWTAEGGPYLLTHTVRVNSGVTLTLGPDVEIVIAEEFDLVPINGVNSAIQTLGNQNSVKISDGEKGFTTIRNLFSNTVLEFFIAPMKTAPELGRWGIPTFDKNIVCDQFALDVRNVRFVDIESFAFTGNISVANSVMKSLTIDGHISVHPPGWDLPAIQSCSVSIDTSTLVNPAITASSAAWTISNSCLIDLKLDFDAHNLQFSFVQNTIVDGSITNNSVLETYDLNGNYWIPSADEIITDRADELPLNLGSEPQYGITIYDQQLDAPHPDTPVCSR